MKRYIITKVIYSKNMFDAVKNENEGEIVQVSLDQDIQAPLQSKEIGFKHGR